MIAQFFAMFKQLFLMFTNLFEAGTKLSNAAVSTASYVEGAAAAFDERTSAEREDNMQSLRSKYAINSRIRQAEDAQSIADLEAKLAALNPAKPTK